MRRYGDYSPNAALLLTPARMGHLQRWAQLPWCDSSDPEERAAEGEGAQRVRAPRKLIGFAGTPEAQEALRKALLAACC